MMLSHPIAQSVIVPFFVALAASVMLRWIVPTQLRWVSMGIGVALLVAYFLIFPGMKFASLGVVNKFPYVVVGTMCLGVVFASLSKRRYRTFAVLWMIGVIVWLYADWLSRGVVAVLHVVGVSVVGISIVLRSMQEAARTDEFAPMMIGASFSLGVLAVGAGSLALGQLSIAFASALGGFAIVNYPRVRLRLDVDGGFALSTLWVLIAVSVLKLTAVHPVALLVVSGLFFASVLLRRMPFTQVKWGRWYKPLFPLLMAVLLSAAAWYVQQQLATSVESPYYQ